VTITIGLVQIFVYDMIPVELHLIFIAAALGIRETDPPPEILVEEQLAA
jgi:hypothetical protein